jgi:hypothetical protein
MQSFGVTAGHADLAIFVTLLKVCDDPISAVSDRVIVMPIRSPEEVQHDGPSTDFPSDSPITVPLA